jgi:hypothetical protein
MAIYKLNLLFVYTELNICQTTFYPLIIETNKINRELLVILKHDKNNFLSNQYNFVK